MPSDKSIAAYFEPLTKTDIQRFKDHVEMATHKLTATELVDQIAEMRAKGYKVTQSASGWNVRAPEKRSFVTPGDIVSVRAQLMAYLDQMWPEGTIIKHFGMRLDNDPRFPYSVGIGPTSRDAMANT
ncbi:hypothetical protein EVC12_158 [Rhizobium phage RHph_I42]|nr:hypothetical protein EVC12_158 [Rhizobium phage RHph_I42]